jgi:uncharacterized protein YacL
VVAELEHLSTSRDPQRSRRGRRGQGVLQELRVGGLAQLSRTAGPGGLHHPGGVDRALLEHCAAEAGRRLVTLDRELAARALELGLPCLPLGELCARLAVPHPVGTVLRVQVEGRGRRPGQGAATLDDGTRVVVEDGARRRGEAVTVRVDRITHTDGGPVLFAQPDEEQPT